MAQGIVDSLFGPQPWQVQRVENAGLGQAADNYASQAPFERAAGQLYRAGGMFGRTGMEAAGYVDPAVADAQMREAVMGMGGDLSTSVGLKAKAAQFYSAGDQRTALKLIMLAKQQEEKDAEIEERKAHAKYYEMGGANKGKYSPEAIAALSDKEMASKMLVAFNTAQAASANMKFPDEESRVKWVDAQVERAKAQYLSGNPLAGKSQFNPQVVSGSVTGNETGLPQMEGVPGGFKGNVPEIVAQINTIPDQADRAAAMAQLQAQVAAAGGQPTAPRPVVAAPTMQQSVEAKARAKATGEKDPLVAAKESAAKETGKGGSEARNKFYDQASSAAVSIPRLDRAIKEINDSKFNPGAFADFRTSINKAVAILGGRDAAAKASDSEILNALLGQDVFNLMGALGLGSKQMDTPAEREFMREVLAGTRTMERESLLKLAQIRKADAQSTLDRFNSQVDSGELDDWFKQSGRPKSKFEIKKPVRKWNGTAWVTE